MGKNNTNIWFLLYHFYETCGHNVYGVEYQEDKETRDEVLRVCEQMGMINNYIAHNLQEFEARPNQDTPENTTPEQHMKECFEAALSRANFNCPPKTWEEVFDGVINVQCYFISRYVFNVCFDMVGSLAANDLHEIQRRCRSKPVDNKNYGYPKVEFVDTLKPLTFYLMRHLSFNYASEINLGSRCGILDSAGHGIHTDMFISTKKLKNWLRDKTWFGGLNWII